jgi:hypothetical protein
VDWINLTQHGKEGIPEQLQDRVARLLMLRRQFTDTSRVTWDWCRLASALVDEHGVDLARLVFDLVDSDALMIHEGQDEAELVAKCLRLHPGPLWNDLSERLVGGSWRIQMEIQGWLIKVIPAEILEAWVCDDIERARLIASIAPVGEDEPTEVARFLLGKFGSDRKVASSMYAQFISGFWTGSESGRIAEQIQQLNGWRQRRNEPAGVREWARNTIQHLEARRREVLEREAEERF